MLISSCFQWFIGFCDSIFFFLQRARRGQREKLFELSELFVDYVIFTNEDLFILIPSFQAMESVYQRFDTEKLNLIEYIVAERKLLNL